METSVRDDFSDEWDKPSLGTKLKESFKLILILTGYAVSFISSVQLGFWLGTEENHPIMENRTFSEWAYEVYLQRDYRDTYLIGIFLDIALLAVFGLQHTLMSRRVLQDTRYWDLVHVTYQIDKPIYLFFTGLALQGLKYFWTAIPLTIWSVPYLKFGSIYLNLIHILAWAVLYGTSLMLDLPDMIGMTQVAISSPTVTAKSHDLQLMQFKQRHMGLLPFMIILIFSPKMPLDRLLLTLGTVYYMTLEWRSETCYGYAKQMKQSKKFT